MKKNLGLMLAVVLTFVFGLSACVSATPSAPKQETQVRSAQQEREASEAQFEMESELWSINQGILMINRGVSRLPEYENIIRRIEQFLEKYPDNPQLVSDLQNIKSSQRYNALLEAKARDERLALATQQRQEQQRIAQQQAEAQRAVEKVAETAKLRTLVRFDGHYMTASDSNFRVIKFIDQGDDIAVWVVTYNRADGFGLYTEVIGLSTRRENALAFGRSTWDVSSTAATAISTRVNDINYNWFFVQATQSLLNRQYDRIAPARIPRDGTASVAFYGSNNWVFETAAGQVHTRSTLEGPLFRFTYDPSKGIARMYYSTETTSIKSFIDMGDYLVDASGVFRLVR